MISAIKGAIALQDIPYIFPSYNGCYWADSRPAGFGEAGGVSGRSTVRGNVIAIANIAEIRCQSPFI